MTRWFAVLLLVITPLPATAADGFGGVDHYLAKLDALEEGDSSAAAYVKESGRAAMEESAREFIAP